MAFVYTESRIMPKQAIASIVSTTAAVPVGTIVRAKDSTLGEGEFIYLPTTASVTQYNLVTFRQNASGTYTCVRTPSGTYAGGSLAVAQATGAASCFGWFMISGSSPVLKTAVIISTNKPVFLSATAGRVKALTSVGRGILGMVSSDTGAAASATISVVRCTMNRPHVLAGA
jgi:hypothetical protein